MPGSPSRCDWCLGALSCAALPSNSVRCAAPLTQSRCEVVIQLHHWHVWLRAIYSAVSFALLAHGPIHFGGTYVQGLVPVLHTSTFIFCLSQQSPFDRETNHHCRRWLQVMHSICFSHFRMAYMSEIRGVSFLYSRFFPPANLSAIYPHHETLHRAGPVRRPCGAGWMWLSRRTVCNTLPFHRCLSLAP
jgi:hypothetical protein